MNWKCKLGFHDYEVIDFVDSKAILWDIIVFGKPSPYRPLYPHTEKLEVKVCLKCGKVVDEIEEAKKDILERINRKEERYAKATEIIGG